MKLLALILSILTLVVSFSCRYATTYNNKEKINNLITTKPDSVELVFVSDFLPGYFFTYEVQRIYRIGKYKIPHLIHLLNTAKQLDSTETTFVLREKMHKPYFIVRIYTLGMIERYLTDGIYFIKYDRERPQGSLYMIHENILSSFNSNDSVFLSSRLTKYDTVQEQQTYLRVSKLDTGIRQHIYKAINSCNDIINYKKKVLVYPKGGSEYSNIIIHIPDSKSNFYKVYAGIMTDEGYQPAYIYYFNKNLEIDSVVNAVYIYR